MNGCVRTHARMHNYDLPSWLMDLVLLDQDTTGDPENNGNSNKKFQQNIYISLAQLTGIAREKRPELMTPCTIQSSFGSAMPMALKSSHDKKIRTTAGFTKRLADV